MKIIIEYFLIAVLLTFIVLYIMEPKPQIILKYPNIEQEVSDTYVDDNNVCYKYHKKEINCPNN